MLCFLLLAIISIEPKKDFKKSEGSGKKIRLNRFFPNQLSWQSGSAEMPAVP
jgi:hypothetical protein